MPANGSWYHRLFGRFQPDAYWNGLLWGLKHTHLSLIPAVLVSEPMAEVLAIAFALLASLTLRCWNKPWGAKAANLEDATSAYPAPLAVAGVQKRGAGCGGGGMQGSPGFNQPGADIQRLSSLCSHAVSPRGPCSP